MTTPSPPFDPCGLPYGHELWRPNGRWWVDLVIIDAEGREHRYRLRYIEPLPEGVPSSPAERERVRWWLRRAGVTNPAVDAAVASEAAFIPQLAAPVLIGERVVDRGLYLAVMGGEPAGDRDRIRGFRHPAYDSSKDPWADRRAANNTTHIEAQELCLRLRQLLAVDGRFAIRLPREVEWLALALAGAVTPNWWGDWSAADPADLPTADACCWYSGNSGQGPMTFEGRQGFDARRVPGRQYTDAMIACGADTLRARNACGLVLPGGVTEFMAEHYTPRPVPPGSDPDDWLLSQEAREELRTAEVVYGGKWSAPSAEAFAESQTMRAIRGACWQAPADGLRSALRGRAFAVTADPYLGIRLACLPPQSSGRSPAAEPPAPEARLDAAEPHDHQAEGQSEL
ncbi:MAG: hypothetical protein ACOCXJ_00330 [Planctomycetota bacterium]